MPKLALRLGTDAVQGFFGVTFDARQGGLPPKNDDSVFRQMREHGDDTPSPKRPIRDVKVS